MKLDNKKVDKKKRFRTKGRLYVGDDILTPSLDRELSLRDVSITEDIIRATTSTDNGFGLGTFVTRGGKQWINRYSCKKPYLYSNVFSCRKSRMSREYAGLSKITLEDIVNYIFDANVKKDYSFYYCAGENLSDDLEYVEQLTKALATREKRLLMDRASNPVDQRLVQGFYAKTSNSVYDVAYYLGFSDSEITIAEQKFADGTIKSVASGLKRVETVFIADNMQFQEDGLIKSVGNIYCAFTVKIALIDIENSEECGIVIYIEPVKEYAIKKDSLNIR